MSGDVEREHGPDCPCPRCQGFQPVHGAYAPGRLAPLAAEWLARLRETVPAVADTDEPTLGLLARQLARIELASRWLDERGIVDARGTPAPVLERVERWERSAAALADRLGLTYAARVELGILERELHAAEVYGEQIAAILAAVRERVWPHLDEAGRSALDDELRSQVLGLNAHRSGAGGRSRSPLALEPPRGDREEDG